MWNMISRMLPALALLLLAGASSAAEVQYSLFVSQNAGKTFNNRANDERTGLDETLYTAQLTVKADETLGIRTEIEGEDSGRVDLTEGENPTASLNPQLVVAAIEWRPAHGHLLRAGLIRMPFSFYNEYRNIGILYPFATLPYAYQPYVGNMNKNLRGLSYGYVGKLGGLAVEATAYAGESQLYSIFSKQGQIDFNRVILPENGSVYDLRIKPFRYQDMIGGQLEVAHEDAGVRFSLGGFNARRYEGTLEETWYSWITGLQWETRYSLLMGEWGRVNENAETYYWLAGLKLNGFVSALDDAGEFMVTVLRDEMYGDRSRGQTDWVITDGVGLRWAPVPELALKLYYSHLRVEFANALTDSDNWNLQIAAAVF